MNEKRFTLTFDDKIVDNLTGITHNVHSGYDVAMDLSGLLNALHDENEQLKSENIDLRKDLGEFEKSINIQGLIGENEQLKHQNELLSDELEQCKAVINNRWSEYLKKKELIE